MSGSGGVDLQVLRTAKMAMEEGLIDEADFNVVKSSFLKAQSFKAGLDAGFIDESQHAEVRQEFFRSLAFGPVAAPGPAAWSAPPPQPSSNTSAPARAPSPRSSVPQSHSIAGDDTLSRPSSVVPPIQAGAGNSNSSAPSSARSMRSEASAGPSAAPSAAPTGIPDHGGSAKTAGKASMSGISVHPDSVNIMYQMRVRKKYRWITFKIGSGGKMVIIDKVGEMAGSTYDQFVDSMPATECRYGVYDYEYVNSDGGTFGKIVFFSWAPEIAPSKAKMQHASTKDFFRGFLDGLSIDLHATEPEELDEQGLRERVQGMVEGRR